MVISAVPSRRQPEFVLVGGQAVAGVDRRDHAVVSGRRCSRRPRRGRRRCGSGPATRSAPASRGSAGRGSRPPGRRPASAWNQTGRPWSSTISGPCTTAARRRARSWARRRSARARSVAAGEDGDGGRRQVGGRGRQRNAATASSPCACASAAPRPARRRAGARTRLAMSKDRSLCMTISLARSRRSAIADTAPAAAERRPRPDPASRRRKFGAPARPPRDSIAGRKFRARSSCASLCATRAHARQAHLLRL